MRIELHHVDLCTRDVAATDALYREVLDPRPEPSLDASRVTGEGCAGQVALVSDGDVRVHLAERDLGVAFRTGQAVDPLHRGHVAFRTDDIVAVKKRLEERGVPYSDYGAWAMGGWHQIFLYDPDGNVVEVHQVVG